MLRRWKSIAAISKSHSALETHGGIHKPSTRGGKELRPFPSTPSLILTYLTRSTVQRTGSTSTQDIHQEHCATTNSNSRTSVGKLLDSKDRCPDRRGRRARGRNLPGKKLFLSAARSKHILRTDAIRTDKKSRARSGCSKQQRLLVPGARLANNDDPKLIKHVQLELG